MPLPRAFLVALTTVAVALLAVSPAAAAPPRVLAIEFENDVNPVTADYVTRELDRAHEEDFGAAVILLDTPGGLAESMRDIYKKELALRDLPVIVYVSPPGARAASAGVRRASNLDAREALRMGVIDEVAPTLDALLTKLDGTRTGPPKRLLLHTANAEVERVQMSGWDRILDTLIDPNIIVLLMSIGTLGIVVELWNPGLIFPGTVGAISLILGLFGLSVLPISWAGVLLMLLAAGFLVADLFVPSHGALTLAGAVSFVFGALMLFNPAGETYQVSLAVAIAIGATMAAFTAFVVTKLIQVRRKPVEVGVSGLVGSVGEVRRDGLVFANGELWRAHSLDGEPLRLGDRVVIDGVDGLELEVRPARDVERATAGPVS